MKKIIEENKSGFTIVELTLTMAFIGMLLIAIAVITTNILAIYQKGTTLKAVNNTGRDLIDSFSSSLTGSSSLNVASECSKIKSGVDDCKADDGFKGFTFNEYRDPSNNKQLYGVFCTGSYSYIWNTEYTLQNNATAGLRLKYTNTSGGTETWPKSGEGKASLVRVLDSRRRVCSATVDNKYKSIFPGTTEINVTHYLDDDDKKLQLDPPEGGLLDSNDVDLVLYELTVFPYSNDATSGHNFYSGTFILGTRRGDLNIQSSGEFCKNSSASLNGGNATETSGSMGNLGAEFNYCAINKFNFAVRSAGE